MRQVSCATGPVVKTDPSPAQATVEELPFVGKPEHRITLAHGRRKRVERRGETHDGDRGVVEFAMPAGATHDDTCRVCRWRGSRLRRTGLPRQFAAARFVRKVERADALDAALPAVEIRCDRDSRVSASSRSSAAASPRRRSSRVGGRGVQPDLGERPLRGEFLVRRCLGRFSPGGQPSRVEGASRQHRTSCPALRSAGSASTPQSRNTAAWRRTASSVSGSELRWSCGPVPVPRWVRCGDIARVRLGRSRQWQPVAPAGLRAWAARSSSAAGALNRTPRISRPCSSAAAKTEVARRSLAWARASGCSHVDDLSAPQPGAESRP